MLRKFIHISVLSSLVLGVSSLSYAMDDGSENKKKNNQVIHSQLQEKKEAGEAKVNQNADQKGQINVVPITNINNHSTKQFGKFK